jgi:hypothetical protein
MSDVFWWLAMALGFLIVATLGALEVSRGLCGVAEWLTASSRFDHVLTLLSGVLSGLWFWLIFVRRV